jgi:radical SAM protein
MLTNDIRTMIPVPRTAADESGGHAYSRNPMLVYWETTQACALACRHCRAEASLAPQAGELTHAEGMTLLRQIAGFTPPLPHLVFTGGDPLMRADIYELIDEAHRLGLSVSITPSVTPALTGETLEKLKLHGISSVGLSLDGSTAERHEAVRGVTGCFNWTMQALEDAARLGLPVQVNTLVSEQTLADLPHMYELLKTSAIMRWSLFFLVSVGRGKMLNPISPEQAEQCMEWVFDLSQIAPFDLKTTEAPAYRRVALTRMRELGWPLSRVRETGVYRGFSIRDGHGIVFVSNQGHIYPAGFLPLAAGNVRRDHLVDVYRNSLIFRALHKPEIFKGKCGRCEYRALCGGSRARGFAATGDPLASDPLCAYEPPEPHSAADGARCSQCAQCKKVACALS